MDDSFNDIEDNIRSPDEVISEQLVEDTRSDYEKQLDEAIYLSFQEMREKEELSRKYEEQLIKEYNDVSDKRKEAFDKLLFDLNKVGKMDKEVRGIYEIVEPIIDSYCSQRILTCELDIETYEKIFKLLGTIRTDKVAVELLKTIIVEDKFLIVNV